MSLFLPCSLQTKQMLTFPSSFKQFRKRLATIFSTVYQDREQVFFAELLEKLNEGQPTSTLFSTGEAMAACERMTDENELLLSEGIVYKI
jgi:DNA replication licensing factor MCM3